MEAKIRNGNLVIVLPLEEPHLSGSKKTLVVASSRGVHRTTARIGGKTVSVVANAFIDRDQASSTDQAGPAETSGKALKKRRATA